MKNERLRRLLWFAYVVALATWVFCIYNELGRIYRDKELFAKSEAHTYVSDFAVFYNAACLTKKHLSEPSLNVYDPKVQELGLREVTAPIVPELPLLAVYPPYFFVMVLPLSLVSLSAAWFIWCGIGLASIVGTLFYLIKLEKWQTKSFSALFFLAATLAAFPTWLSFKLGQVSLLLPAGLTLFWYLLRTNKTFLAGVSSLLCILKVQYLPMLTLIGLIRGKARFLAGLGLVSIALTLISYAVLGMENILSFPGAVKYNETAGLAGGVSAYAMQNFRGQLNLLLGGDTETVHLLTMVIFVLSSVSVAALWWKMRAPIKLDNTDSVYKLAAAATIVVLLIASPHTHEQDYIALVPACLWIWQHTKSDTVFGDQTVCMLLRGSILAFPFLSWIFFMLQFVFHLLKIQPFFIWAIFVLVLTSIRLKSMTQSVCRVSSN